MCANQPPRDKEKREPKRQIRIYAGDFNTNLSNMLVEHPIPEKESTFCVLDQRTFECDWNSVKTLATHKKGGNKIELFYFFPEGWINRSVAALKIHKEQRLEKWWGDSTWSTLLQSAGSVRAQHVCERFKSELKYRHVYPFPIYEEKDKGGE